MSRKYSDILEALRNYKRIAIRVKHIVRKYDPNAKIFVFGSVVRGKFTSASDIDILIVTERIDLKYDIIVDVYRSIEAPLELHVVTQKQLEDWYLRFIDPEELEEI